MDYSIKEFILESTLNENAVVLCGILDTFDEIGYTDHDLELNNILMGGDEDSGHISMLAVDAVLNEHMITLLLAYGFRLNADNEMSTVFLSRLLDAIVALEAIEDKLVLEDALCSGDQPINKMFNCLMVVSDLGDYELEENVIEISPEFLEKIESTEITPEDFFERDDSVQVGRIKQWGKLKEAEVVVTFLNTVGRLGFSIEAGFEILKDDFLAIDDTEKLAYNVIAFVLASDSTAHMVDIALAIIEKIIPDINKQGVVGNIVAREIYGLYNEQK